MRKWLKQRLAGEVPLARAFFHEMLVMGTMLNVITGLLALVAFSFGGFVWLGVLVFISPLPYNIVVSLAVLRSARRDSSRLSEVARIGTFIWFPTMLFI